MANPGEQCDGTDLDNKTCKALGFFAGTLTCDSSCKLIKAGCTHCGDGKLQAGEQCDGAALNKKKCADLGFDSGSLKCDGGCKLDSTGCVKFSCNDGKLDPNEQCEGKNLNNKKCADLGFSGGTLKCHIYCVFDTSGCYKCGDGKINGNEKCDGLLLVGKQCADFSPFHSGTLACKGDCSGFDLSGCNKCGDGKVNGKEKCDGTPKGGKSCKSLGYVGGAGLGCKSDCTLDTSYCIYKDSLGTWAPLKAGTFTMGSPKSELCREPSVEKETQHKVTLSHAFEILATEVTQEQFIAAMGHNPSKFSKCGKTCPVEFVNWHQAASYCNALSDKKKLARCYKCSQSGPVLTCAEATGYAGAKVYGCPGYRLPTEAEWEYAYRAGSTTALYSGAISDCSKDAKVAQIAWYYFNSGDKSQPVGLRPPNAWGLYDMAGNVFEWCHDGFQKDLGAAPVTDPAVAASTYRVMRGGSYTSLAGWQRAANRFKDTPEANLDCHGSYGFRVARTIKP